MAGLVAAVVSATVPSLIGAWQARNATGQQGMQSYYDDIREDVTQLQTRLDALEGYVIDLEGHVDELHAMMVKAGLTPPARPRRPRRSL